MPYAVIKVGKGISFRLVVSLKLSGLALYLAAVKQTVYPGNFNAIMDAPASKSCMQRACALALLHKGATIISKPGKSNDDLAAIQIIQNLGAVTEERDGALHIYSNSIRPVSNSIHCGESGLAVRMFTPIAALGSAEIHIDGEGSLLKRPLHFMEEILPQLGVTVASNGGFLPLKVKGPLQNNRIRIDASDSSQYLTGLLMAFAHCGKPGTIEVINLNSKPYIDLTLQMMQHFGYEVKNEQYQKFEIAPYDFNKAGKINYAVEGDWSNAAFFLVAGAIAGKVVLKNLNLYSRQADKEILKVLKLAGVHISIADDEIMVRKSILKAFQFDATHCPDLFPPLLALAAYCEGVSIIEGTERLLHKESNRALTLQQEFSKFGVCISIREGKMFIEGKKGLTAASIFSHNDHRIAMACAVAALDANGAVKIDAAGAVNKSYPGFFDTLQKAGINISQSK